MFGNIRIKFNKANCVSFTLGVLIITLPLQWFDLLNVGPLSFKPVHLVFLLFIFVLIFFHSLFRGIYNILIEYKYFFIFYSFYLIVMYLRVLYSDNLFESFALNTKNLIYFLYCIILTGLLYNNLYESKHEQLGRFVNISLIVFLIICVYVFQQLERSFFIEYGLALIRGDINELMFGFYKPIFNYSFGNGDIDPESNQGTSLRNTLVGSFILFIAMVMKELPNRVLYAKILSFVILTVCLLLIIASVSRSNYLTLFLVSFMAFIFNLKLYKQVKLFKIPILFISACIFITIIFYGIPYLEPVIGVVVERILELTKSGRIEMYSYAIKLINDNWFFGYGTGATLTEFHDLQVHNLFLAAWYQTGILGFISSILFYLSLLVYLILILKGYVISNDKVKGDIWLIAVVVLPLFRSLISGNSGNFTMIEWTCISMFLTMGLKYSKSVQKDSVDN